MLWKSQACHLCPKLNLFKFKYICLKSMSKKFYLRNLYKKKITIFLFFCLYNTKQRNKLIFKRMTKSLDIPYATYFNVEDIWEVTKDPSNPQKSILKLFANIIWNKSCIMKNTITNRTINGLKEAYDQWL